MPQIVLNPQATLQHGRPEEGFSMIEEIPEAGEISLSFTSFLDPGEHMITGEVMLKRAKRIGECLGLRTAEALLKDPSVVPEELRRKVLVFAGCVLMHPNAVRVVPALYPNGSGYDLDFAWLGHHSFGSGCILVRAVDSADDPAKVATRAIAKGNAMSQKPSFQLAGKTIAEGQPTFIIAEAGVNHGGELEVALKLVDAAAEAGADAVKFQTFKAEQVVTGAGTMADYQKRNSGEDESQVAMLRKLELQEEFYGPLRERCKERGILFLSTPHGGFESVDFLANLGVEAFKFGSGDLTNLPVIAHAARVGIPLIFGTGMAILEEVKEAVQTCYDAGNRNVVMLHCTTNYPCPENEVDLRAMQTMMQELDCLVGYSDHTMGIQVPIMAATLGATVIEKHFTLARTMKGPDHAASLEPEELKAMVEGVHQVPVIMGSPEKKPHASEADVTIIARKSVVALRDIKAGEPFTKENLGIKRPGSGLHPRHYLDILGKKAKKDISGDTTLSPDDV